MIPDVNKSLPKNSENYVKISLRIGTVKRDLRKLKNKLRNIFKRRFMNRLIGVILVLKKKFTGHLFK